MVYLTVHGYSDVVLLQYNYVHCKQILKSFFHYYFGHIIVFHPFQYGVWSQPDSINQTEEALILGTDIITYYEELFKIPFPLVKQGQSFIHV